MKCDIHAYNMLYNSVRFCIFKRPSVHCYCCFSLGYTKKHTYFHISFSNENRLGNLIANPWLFWPPEDALIFLLSLEKLCVQITTHNGSSYYIERFEWSAIFWTTPPRLIGNLQSITRFLFFHVRYHQRFLA